MATIKPVLHQRQQSYANPWAKAQIVKANAEQKADTNLATSSLEDILREGLGLMSTQSNSAQGDVDLSNYQPYMDTGALASQEAAKLAGLGDNAYSSQEIYDRYLNNSAVQAQMQQGNNMINSNAAAKGMLGSGAILKALQGYGQGIASQGLGAAQTNLYNLATQGATAANQYASSLLNKYTVDNTAAQQGMAQQSGLISNYMGNYSNLQGRAIEQRQSSLIGAAGMTNDTYGMGYKNYMANTLNTSFRG